MRNGNPDLGTAERWFSTTSLEAGVTLVSEPHAAEFIRGNFFLVDCGDETLVVDSGLGLASVRDEFPECVERPAVLVLTHAHNDHRGGASEFEVRLAHRLEAATLETRAHGRTRPNDWPTENLKAARAAGYELPDYMLEREPRPDFDPDDYWIAPARPTRFVDDGDTLDIGNRRFSVMHLPGHTPGSIGIFEEKTGALFAGDTLYDGPLVDALPESNVDDFVRSVARIRGLPVSMVHGGHGDSFSGRRMTELADAYLQTKEIGDT